MNIKKMFTTLSAMVVAVTMSMPSVSVFGATYSDELVDAYNWAHDKGITTMATIDDANMYGAITRAEMAKMLSVYAEKVLEKEPNTSAACTFSDIDSVGWDLHEFIIESCQLGIMGQGITAFRPYDTISRAEFGTALSRLLYGIADGNPYYATHLSKLKEEWIMNQIANAESTKEVRGYVMLMLMRSEWGNPECDDPLVKVACAMESDEGCPAACRADNNNEEENTDTVVKAGDLEVTAKSASSRKVVIDGTSDMDTINLKSSDDKITLSKVTLERYGYSSTNDVESVWLENEDGTAITEPKALNSKDQVTLNIKKDYRELSSSDVFTIVVKTVEATDEDGDGKLDFQQGSTIWFKVTSIESSAANVDLDDYDPYTYDMVSYEGGVITVDAKWKNTTNHFDSKESYEVAKLKIKATSTTALVNGFVLTNEGDLDLKDWLEDVEVTVDWEAVKTTWSLDKKQLTVSFSDVEIAQKTSTVFAVKVTLADDFDEFGDDINFQIAKSSDVKAIEKKTWSRVTVDPDAVIDLYSYVFNGSKITLTNTKLGTVEATAGTSDVVVWEGTIELGGQEVTFNDFYIWATAWIEAMRLAIGDDEFEGTAAAVANCNGADTCWKFSVSTEESGKVQFIADVDDDAVANITFNFNDGATTSFGKNVLVDVNDELWEYEGGSAITKDDFVGSISLNTLKVQPAKGSLENNLTSNSVEFKRWETTKKTIFDGTYTAKKQNIYLNTYSFEETAGTALDADSEITFHVYVDGTEVDADTMSAGEDTLEGSFSDVKIEAGKEVKVKVVAEMYAGEADANDYTYELTLSWDNEDGEDGQWEDSDDCIKMELVGSSSMTITSPSANTVILQSNSYVDLAAFVIAPDSDDEDSDADLDELTFTINEGVAVDAGDIKVKIGSSTYEVEVVGTSYSVVDLDETLDSAGTNVTISVKGLVSDPVGTTLELLTPKTKTFNKLIVPALVKIKSQADQNWSSTKYVVSVEKFDKSYVVADLDLDGYGGIAWEFENNEEFEIPWQGNAPIIIQNVTYNVFESDGVTDAEGAPVAITKGTYKDYFKVNGNDLRIYKLD